MSTQGTQPSRLESREMNATETVEQFLARGGRIERIEAHPDPEGRVLRRGRRPYAAHAAGARARSENGLA
jgi:hypothetical protein